MVPNFLTQFNWVDVVVLVFILRGVFRGIRNGVVLEFLSLSGWCVALYLSLKYYKPIASTLYERTEIPLVLNEIIIFGGIALGTIMLANLLGQFFKRIVRIKIIERINFLGGAVLGMVKAGVVVSFLFYLLGITEIPYLKKSIEEKSISGKVITKVVNVVYRNVEDFFFTKRR
ncbi:MAG: CvpA family protein [Candidatus Omnitrophica bacterium]|nr:CvpA family protein [Candidatus Omnitrophota bacterium]